MQIPLRRYWTLLATYLRPQRLRFGALAVLLLGSIGLELLNPQILRSFIDTALAGGAESSLLQTALLFVGVAVAQQVVAVLARYVSENVGWSATNALRGDLAEHCLRLDQSFHKARTPGELIERVDGDVTALANFFSQLVVSVVGNLLLLSGVLVLVFREDWRAGLALTLFTLAALAVMTQLRAAAVPLWAAERESNAQFFGFLGEQISGTEDLRGNGATGYVMRRFYTLLRGWLPVSRRATMAAYHMWISTIILFALGSALSLGLGAYLWSQGQISIGTVYLLFTYTELLRRPIEEIRTQLQDLQKAGASIARIQELLAIRSRIVDGPGLALPTQALAVEFEHVSFGYDEAGSSEAGGLGLEASSGEAGRLGLEASDDGVSLDVRAHNPSADSNVSLPDSHTSSLKPQASNLKPQAPSLVLHDLSFQVRPGEVLGLLGRTGSGKSTIARLLLRLYDPQVGMVRLGGVDLRATRLAELRQRVGVVTQEVQLFQGSVRDNLTFYDSSIPDAHILAALEALGLRGWAEALPQGLDTELVSGGGLSAGEAQLLAFTRVLLSDPGLIILDEASSRLDPATEQLIERAVGRLLHGRTGVIIAHRLSTLQRADTIMLLEDGRIAEYGPRAALAADPNTRFAALLRAGLEEVLA
ncbi:MAG: hypothetical protein OHK0022_11020 [Roseiflexaceae bacterium]